MAEDSLDARFAAAEALGRNGDLQGSEAAFRAILDDVRDREPVLEARALRCLAVTYGVGGRTFEAWALADAATRAARTAGDDRELGLALGTLCGALYCLDTSEPLPALLDELAAVLERLPEGTIPWGWREHHEARFAHAILVGDAAGAREHLVRYEASLPTGDARDPTDTVVLHLFRARLAQLDGDHAAVLDCVAPLRDVDVDRPSVALAVKVSWLESLADDGQNDEARAAGRDALLFLQGLEDEPFTSHDRLEMGRRAAEALSRIGATQEAHRAYDIAATAVLEHVALLDASVRRLPELGIAEGVHEAVMVDARRRYVAEQSEITKRVARLLEEDDIGIKRLLAHEEDGWVRICAWCECLRGEDGTWLPLGQFVPREGPLRITHGICPACMAKATTGP